MARKSAKRFVILHNGTLKELFSVVERNNGDLVIVMRPCTNYEMDDGNSYPIKEQRYSVHCSNQSTTGGNLLKQTVQLENGTVLDSAAFIHPGPSGLLWMIYSRRAAALSNPRYNSRPKDRDTVITLGVSDQNNCLCYSIIVSSHEIVLDLPLGHSYQTFKIGGFYITFLATLILVPEFGEEDLTHYLTSPPRLNGVPFDGRSTVISYSINYIGCFLQHFSAVLDFRIKLNDRLRKHGLTEEELFINLQLSQRISHMPRHYAEYFSILG